MCTLALFYFFYNSEQRVVVIISHVCITTGNKVASSPPECHATHSEVASCHRFFIILRRVHFPPASHKMADGSVNRVSQCGNRACDYSGVCLPRIHDLPDLAASRILPHPLSTIAQVCVRVYNIAG